MVILSRLFAVRPIERMAGVFAAFIALAIGPGMALAEGASPWAEGFHSRARLLAGPSDGTGQWAAVEIVLDRGFKTYWRQPGESGLPPRFDWTGSTNLSSIDLHWPAPSRTEDAGGVTHTYSGRFVLPLYVTAHDRRAPVVLRLAIEYGVCKEICIPAQAALDIEIAREGPYGPIIQQALAQVPRPQPVGAEGRLSILGVARVVGEKPTYQVRVRAPDGAMLFAEPPEDWYVSTSRLQADRAFTITVDEKPSGATGPVPLRLTLVGGDEAIETQVRLD